MSPFTAAIENSRAVAQELIAIGLRHGVDLEPLRKDDVFIQDRRWVWFWRKDSLPGTGPAQEPLGTLHYNLQGTVSVLPRRLKESARAFQGMWSEAGTFENLDQALELVKAWLLEAKEVDDLPSRAVRRYSI
jgi:hypothetical protein